MGPPMLPSVDAVTTAGEDSRHRKRPEVQLGLPRFARRLKASMSRSVCFSLRQSLAWPRKLTAIGHEDDWEIRRTLKRRRAAGADDVWGQLKAGAAAGPRLGPAATFPATAPAQAPSSASSQASPLGDAIGTATAAVRPAYQPSPLYSLALAAAAAAAPTPPATKAVAISTTSLAAAAELVRAAAAAVTHRRADARNGIAAGPSEAGTCPSPANPAAAAAASESPAAPASAANSGGSGSITSAQQPGSSRGRHAGGGGSGSTAAVPHYGDGGGSGGGDSAAAASVAAIVAALLDGGVPAALAVAASGMPCLAALRARRPQPRGATVVASTPSGPATNMHTMAASDLARLLTAGCWLNDEVVNFYMLLIRKRNDEARRAPPTAVPAAEPVAASAQVHAAAAATASGGAAGRVSSAKATPVAPVAKSAAATAAANSAAAGRGAAGRSAASGNPAAGVSSPGERPPALSKGGRAAATRAPAPAPGPSLGRPTSQPDIPCTTSGCGGGGAAGTAPAPAGLNGRPGSLLTPPPPHPAAAAAGRPSAVVRPPRPQHGGTAPYSVYAFNSFFFAKLTDEGKRRTFVYDAVRRWTLPARTHTADCVTGRELLLFPINHGNTHWCLAAVWPRRRLLQYFDSLGGSAGVAKWVLETLLRWLLRDAQDKGVGLEAPMAGGGGAEEARGTMPPAAAMVAAAAAAGGAAAVKGGKGKAGGNAKANALGRGKAAGAVPATATEAVAVAATSGWKLERVSGRLPQQHDGSSCGLFACCFAELLSRGVPPEGFRFSQADILKIRRGMAEQVLRAAL